MSTMASISELTQAISRSITALAALFIEDIGATKATRENLDAVIELERAFNQKTLIDSAFAQSVREARAGNLVGSTRPVDFLAQHLDISRPEALSRLRLGLRDFGQMDEHTDEDARAYGRDVLHRHAISAEKQKLLERELKKLQNRPELHGLRVRAAEEASTRSFADLRTWIREQVAMLNDAHTGRDPSAGARRRHLVIGAPDADGGSFIRGYLPAATTALLEAALAPARNPGHLSSVPAEEDTRGLQHRRVDALHHLLRRYHQDKTERNGGVGSIVVSLSIKDLRDITPHTRFPTNTHSQLNALDILMLGAAEFDFGVVHDPDSGSPLHLGRTARSASLEQRIALMAAQGVCIFPGCEQPLCNCDIHHITAWADGGFTDIENLCPFCRSHHTLNNDTANRSHGRRGQAEHDPATGRTGYRPPTNSYTPDPSVQLNETVAQNRSAGAKIRRQ
ncbi:HNH endonuclease signature motif containing protein [Corynebacterium pacaense]|uniref:HNH endonuclease signature motif containing protein n=1 Tax=Corynebacterium pacaense TaxID=1816684 RepID=UPI001FEB8EE3|nr:HNH endonuclease signature motif containing protein [Corynebacterium pacaense]